MAIVGLKELLATLTLAPITGWPLASKTLIKREPLFDALSKFLGATVVVIFTGPNAGQFEQLIFNSAVL